MKNRYLLSTRGVLAVAAAAAMLSGCFGGSDDDDTPPVTSQVPPAASQSTANFISYLEQLVASSADTLEPVDTSGLTAPTDDTSEPLPIN